MKVRAALATNFISPYRVPLYSALGGTDNWDFKVFSCCDSEFNRCWKPIQDPPFQHKTSFNFSYMRVVKHRGLVTFTDRRQVHIPLGLWFDLWRFHPDVIFSDEMGARSLIAAIYAFLMRKRLVIWFYGTLHTERDISWKQRMLRAVLVRAADAFIGMGVDARRYLESIGVPSNSIFHARNATAIASLRNQVVERVRGQWHKRFGSSELCFLYVGQLNQRKNLHKLLEAWESFGAQDDVRASLILVGDGPDKADLQRRVAHSRLTNVAFVGHLEPEKLPEIFHAADVFVFPTLEDVWGLVVNEAMTFGLPVICSKYAGCAADLICEDKNGWIVDPEDARDLAKALRRAWDARNRKEEMARAARESMSSVTISNMANGFQEAVKFVLAQSNVTSEKQQRPESLIVNHQ